MRDGSRRRSRGMRFVGGLLWGVIAVGGLLAALSLTRPFEPATARRAAEGSAEPSLQDGEPLAAIAPEIAPSDPALPAPVPQPSAEVNRPLRGLEPSAPAEDGRFTAPDPFETTVSDSQLSGLPPAATLEGPAPVVEIPQVENPAFQLPGPALVVNAVQFERRAEVPLIAVILNDAGRSELAPETLLSLPVPLTLGIAPRSRQDLDLAAQARLSDYEVLAQLPVAASGDGSEGSAIHNDMSDLEVAERVEELMSSLWMSVGASGLADRGTPLDERVMRGVFAVLERNGFAFVNADAASIETGRAIALAFSVVYAGSSRTIEADATAEEVYKALEAAASAAQQVGPLIVSGPPSRAMLEGVLKWDIERGRRAAQIAPVSAVIRQMIEG